MSNEQDNPELEAWFKDPQTAHQMKVAKSNRSNAVKTLVSAARQSSDAVVRQEMTRLAQYDESVENLGGKKLGDDWS